MSVLLYEALKEKYRTNAINDPLAFTKDAIDWNIFPPLLRDLYHSDFAQILTGVYSESEIHVCMLRIQCSCP